MAKTEAGRKIVSVRRYTKKVNGKTIRIKPYRRSTPTKC